METILKLGDRVTKTVERTTFHGHVILVHEDYVLVAWDNGVVCAIDEEHVINSLVVNKQTYAVA